MNADRESSEWIGSKAARKRLKVSACDLMHLREAGLLRYRKQGNAFLYASEDMDNVRGTVRDR